MIADYQQSLDTLLALYPHGPWLLTALPVERQSGLYSNTRTFYPNDQDSVVDWLKEYSGGDYNIYFSVNPPNREMHKKAERTDIKSLCYLHVDLDPRAGENIYQEQERIENLLLNERPAGVPEPTMVTFSGGGYWGFWRLDNPTDIDGDEQLYEEAKLYNLQLELLFGADSCHNVDRIARLPGTVNYPDKRKAAKGRVPSLASITAYNDIDYPLAKFTKAPQVQASGGFTSGNTVVISENVERVESLDMLPASVPAWTKVVIAQGKDPDDPNRFAKEGRSGALWHVVCELVRNGVSDDTIYAIITDPDWAISESVLDGTNGRPDRYARRQIERAKDFAVDPKFASFNERYAVVQNAGNGKCRIIYEDSMNHLVAQAPGDFKAFYANDFVTVPTTNGATKQVPVGRWWFEHPSRRSYRNIVFLPGQEVPRDTYNLWQGFGYEAIPGGSCDLYLDHLKKSICKDDPERFEYLLNWMARAVQQPNEPGMVAIVLRGRQGAGKGTFAKPFTRLFGRHGKQITDSKHLVGAFNAHLRDCVVLFADECIAAGNKQHEASIKTLVTEESIMIEAKGVDATVERNYLHVIMASNDDWVVPTGVDDRRFVVFDVSNEKVQDREYFGNLYTQLERGGYEALLFFLMTRDISEFDPSIRPETDELRDQKQRSFDEKMRWWYDVLDQGALCDHSIFSGGDFPVGSVVWEYNQPLPANKRLSPFQMSKFILKATDGSVKNTQLSSKQMLEIAVPSVNPRTGEPSSVSRPRVYRLPNLQDLRDIFDANFGGPYDWSEIEEDDNTEIF
jgi:hypothetical protein